MRSALKRMALLLVIASAIVAISAMTAQAGDKIVEEIRAAYTDNVEVRVIPKIDNFIILFDQSGSMFMTEQGTVPAKAKVGKDIMSALNERLPELGYNGSVMVFSPDRSLIGPEQFNRTSFGESIESLPETGRIHGNRTPLGDSIMQMDGLLSKSAGKTAVLIVSDGEKNIGMDALEAAKTLTEKYPNVCFHAVSLADSDQGKTTLQDITKLNDCVYADGNELTADAAALDQFAKDVFYTVQVREIVEEVVAVEAVAAVPSMDTVHFEFDKSDLTPEAKMKLDEAAEILRNRSDLRVVIQGHTDNTGPETYNLTLSEQRAQAVHEYLRAKGIAPERMETVGYGLSQPVTSNSTPEGRAQNRRSEILPAR
ncbi:MAG: OmpA family protein [Syntrophobacterales bacterium]